MTIAGTGGVGVANITLGDASTASYGAGRLSQLLLAGHNTNANVQAGTVIIGEHTGSVSTNGANGSVTFDTGTFNAANIQMALDTSGTTTTGVIGAFTLGTDNNSTGVLNVSNSFYLADNTNATTVGTANGTFTINGGTANLQCNISVPSTQGSSNTTLSLQGGTLNMNGHAIGGDGTGNTGLAISLVNLVTNSGTATLANLGGGGINNAGLSTGSTGILILAGANTYTGNTTINSGGTLQIGSATQSGSLPSGGNVSVNGSGFGGNGALNFSASTPINDSSVYSGSGTIQQSGTGTTALSGSSPSFSGPINITSGKLSVTGSLAGANTTSVTGGTLSGTGTVGGIDLNGAAATVQPGSTASPLGTLTANGLFNYDYGGGTLAVTLGSTTSSKIAATDATFNTVPTFSYAFAAAPTVSTYTVLTTTNPIMDLGNLASISPSTVGRMTLTPSEQGGPGGNSIIVTIAGSPATLHWKNNGGNLNTWDIQNNQNWDSAATSGNPYQFYQVDSVVFDDNVNGNSFTVDIRDAVQPSAVTFSNSNAHPYTINSSNGNGIGGSGSLTVNGTGTVTLNTVNTYTGGTIVSSGTLVAGNDSALGDSTSAAGGLVLNPSSGTATVKFTSAAPAIASLSSSGAGSSSVVLGNTASPAATTLTVGAGGSTTSFGGVISDLTGTNAAAIGSLTLVGGQLTLTGANTYTGNTTVSGGTLILGSGGSIASSNVNVNGGNLNVNPSGSILGTHVNIAGGASMTVASGGLIPTTTNLVDNGTVTFNASQAIATLNGSGALNETGTLTISGNGTFSGSINDNGPGSLSFTGGTVNLTGSSTYSGNTTIGSGSIVSVASANGTSASSLGAITGGNVIVSAGGTLNIGGYAAANSLNFGQKVFHISGNGVGGIGALTNRNYVSDPTGATGGAAQENASGALQNVVLDGDASVGGPGQGPDQTTGAAQLGRIDIRGPAVVSPTPNAATLNLNSHNLTKFGNSFLDLVNVTVSGAGNIIVAGTNASGGSANFGNTFTLEGSTVFQDDGTSKILVGDGATLQFWNPGANGQANLTRAVEMGDGLSNSNTFMALGGGTSNVGSNINLRGNLTFRSTYQNFQNNNLTLNGNITQDSTPRKIIKNNIGMVTLAGNNTFTGGVEIDTGPSSAAITTGTGTVQLGSNTALSAANVLSMDPTTGFTSDFQLNSYSATIAGLQNTGAATASIVENANAMPAILTVNNSSNYSFSGVVQNGTGGGALSLTKSGPGMLTLTGANTYTGNTTISGGTLQLSSGGSLSSSTNVTLAGGKMLLNGASQTFTTPLAVTGVSSIDLNKNSTLHFADSSALSSSWSSVVSPYGKIISIDNWTGVTGLTGGSSTDPIFFGNGSGTGLTSNQLGLIHFQGYNGAEFLTANTGEVVPASVSPYHLGDVTLDNHVDASDILAMEQALANLSGYQNQGNSLHVTLSNEDMLNIFDVNGDGNITYADLQSLLSDLKSGKGNTSTVPEPASFLLLGLGSAMLFAGRARRKVRIL
ncbi:MAG TPA: autotransporter-associated beta strand repeat-containing protein [Pirellulales bacterium]|nr:autotransporter-associated beta strand repeat-containing protein [Pirellulales bacterium]